MADAIKIPLSDFQRARFTSLAAEAKQIEQRQQEAVIAIASGTLDMLKLASEGWSIRLDATEIVCTPPETKAGSDAP